MTDKKSPLDLLRLPGLGYRRLTPEEKRYAFFNRRLFAFTLDAILLMIFVAPIVDLVFASMHGPFPVDMMKLRQEMSVIPDPAEANRLFLQTIIETGAAEYWFRNVMYQVTALLTISGLFWLRWGATPGKMVMRIKVVDAKTEGPVSLFQVVMRASGYLISAAFFLLGFFWIGIDKRRQGWHDKLAETVVLAQPLWTLWRKKTKPDSPAADP